MKKITHVFLILAVAIIPVSLFALELRVGEQPNISQNERINGDVYIAGGTVQTSGQVSGDLVALGGSVLVNGNVSADVIAGGGNVTILGTVGDDVRVGGGNIVVGAKIGGDLVIGGGQVQITGEGISGDLLIGGGVVSINAPVAGNIRIGGGEVTLNAPVGGNIEFTGEKLKLGKSASVNGNLTYKAKEKVVLEEGAIIKGETKYEAWKTTHKGSQTSLKAIISGLIVGKFLMLLLAAMIFGLYFRKYFTDIIHVATERPMIEIGRGLAILILLPVVSIMLLVTFIGIPLGILGLVGFVALLILGAIATQIVLGSVIDKWMFKKEKYEVSWRTILLGAFLYALLGIIPIIGWIISCGFMLLTVGATMKVKWGIMKTLR